MIANVFNNRLTLFPLVAILSALSPSLVAVRGESRKNQEMPIQARLIRRLRYSMQEIIYGGRYLGSFGSHGSLAMSLNPNNVHRPTFERVKRCLLTFKRDHTMSQNNSAQQANTHAQIEQSTPVTVNFSHRLSNKKADMANIIDLVDTVDDMTYRATGILEVLSIYISNSQRNEILDKESICAAMQSAIKDIHDLNAVVNAYAGGIHHV